MNPRTMQDEDFGPLARLYLRFLQPAEQARRLTAYRHYIATGEPGELPSIDSWPIVKQELDAIREKDHHHA